MAALPDNDRITGPFIASAGQTAFPADFPLIRREGLRLRIRRGAVYLPVEAYPDVDADAEGVDGFTAVRATGCQAGDQVWVFSDLAPERMRQHTPNGAVRSATLEADAIEFQAQLQEHRRDLALTMSVLPGDTPPSPESLSAAAEAGEMAQAALVAVEDRIAKDKYPVIRDLSLEAGDGVTDCSAILKRTDVGFLTLPPGDYRVKADCTITRPLYFAPGSRMTIDAGVTVTFAGRGRVTSDSRRQIFYGVGAVSGLPHVDVTWFAGDKIYFFSNQEMVNLGDISASVTGANADVELQKAFNAVRACGAINLQDGVLTKGPALISCPVQVSIRGRRQSSIFIWNTTTTNGFALPYERSNMDGFSLRRADLNVPSAAGAALVVSGANMVRDFYINGAYIAGNSDNQSGPIFKEFEIFNSRYIGLALIDTNDPVVSTGFIVTDDEYTAFSSASGGWNPQPNDTLTGSTSGCKMRVKRIGSTFLIATRFYGVAAKPQIGETYTCSSGGAATLSTYVMNHQLGGLRIVQNDTVGPLTEAVMLKHLDIIGGRHNITIDGAAALFRQGPSYNRASDLWLDSALDSALVMSRTDGWTFSGACIQSRFDGLVADNIRNCRFIGGDIRHCAAAGAVLGPGCSALDFIGTTIADNRYGVPGNTGAHVVITNDPATRITFTGGTIGRSVSDGVTTDYGISLIGAGGQLYLWGVRFGETASIRLGAIQNLSSVTSYTVDGCSGLILKQKGSFAVAVGASASAPINHTLSVQPTFVDFKLTTSDPGGLGGAYCIAIPSADITPTTFIARLYDNNAALVNATRNIVVNWEIDLSYKV